MNESNSSFTQFIIHSLHYTTQQLQDKRDPMVALSEFFITSDNYTCDTMGGKMTSPTTWIGIFGFFLMGILLSYK